MNKRILSIVALVMMAVVSSSAQKFEDYFTDNTLRLDYAFAGDVNKQEIYLDELYKMPRWYGRRQHLDSLPLAGNGQITVVDSKSQRIIYRHSFSTLFQEWLATAEAKRVKKSFENVFLVPFPKADCDITVTLFDYHAKPVVTMTHHVDPADILIRKTGYKGVTPYKTMLQARDTTRCIHIAFVAEGYTQSQMDDYLDDVKIAMDALFAHEPFKSLKSRFNIVAVGSLSLESGTSIPSKDEWKSTTLSSNFSTFYSERYMTTLHLKKLHDILAGTPYEHIIVLVNTEKYGGGGIYNSYNLSFTKGPKYRPVVVHEFGHSFGGLGDEYAYSDSDPMYFADTEPWEPNLTTKHDFGYNKWQNLIDEGKAGFYEGGGYLTHGVWRGEADCRMLTNENPVFCSVCQQALTRLIDFYTK